MSLSAVEKIISNREEFKLTAERLVEWNWYNRFIAMNPDIADRWEQHKTYEILKDEHLR